MTICLPRVVPVLGQIVSMTRPGLTGMVAFSALVGYVAAPGQHLWPVALLLWLGIALLSAAASILNQIQEVEIDACMERTRTRPLVDGSITAGEAQLLFAGSVSIGFALLAAVSIPAALTGLFSLVLYNGLYTPLKRYTSLALFPGALSGALPVAAGWLIASGPLYDPQLYSFLIFMVLWQVPHFICLAICERDDYRQAGLSLIPDAVTSEQLLQLLRLWTAALAVGGLQLIAIGFLSGPHFSYTAIGLILWLILRSLLPKTVTSFHVFASGHGRRLKLFLTLFLLLLLFDSVLV